LKQLELKPIFTNEFPRPLEEGVLFVSITNATAAHLCPCGCGNEVITPLSPTDWCLIYDGDTVSLHPSIGNWAFVCRSHYLITRNEVHWARQWSEDEIARGRAADRAAKDRYYRELAFGQQPATRTSDRGVRKRLSTLFKPKDQR
jgi:hypothetical protein